MNTLILCAGKGSRFQEVSQGQPKAMAMIGQLSIIQRLLLQILNYDLFGNIYINFSRYSKDLPNHLISFPQKKIFFSYEEEPLGPSLTAYNLGKHLDSDLLVIHGDLLLQKGLIIRFCDTLTFSQESVCVIHERPLFGARNVVTIDSSGYLQEFIGSSNLKHLQPLPDRIFSDSGIYYFSRNIFHSNFIAAPKVGISSSLLPLVSQKFPVKTYQWLGKRVSIEDSVSYSKAQSLYYGNAELFD